jgi:hypothetical protein
MKKISKKQVKKKKKFYAQSSNSYFISDPVFALPQARLQQMNSVEDTNTMQLLWEDSETLSDMNKGSETESQANVEDDLLGLCSGNFGETQAPKPNDVNSSMNGLFTQPATQSVEDAELMGLCSGTFATQLPVQVEKFFLGFLVGFF